MPTSHTLTGDLSDLVGTGFPRDSVWVTIRTNLGDDADVRDATGKKLRLPYHRFALPADGTFSKDLWSTSALTNPTAYQYQVEVEYPTGRGGVGRQRWISGWFSHTADQDLSELAYDPLVPPVYYPELLAARDEAVTAKDDAEAAQAGAEAAQAAAEAVGATTDAQVESSLASRGLPVTGSDLMASLDEAVGAEETRALAAEADLQTAIDGLAISGTLTVGGAWSASPGDYSARTLVTYSGGVYVSSETTVAADVPGTSPKWVAFPAFLSYGTDLGTADLNTIVNTGEYIQTNLAYPSGARNYPQTAIGVLTVRRFGTRVFQQWVAVEGTGTGWGTQVYWRSSANTGSTWTAWSNAAVRSTTSPDANSITITGTYARTGTSGASNWPTSALGFLTVYANADGSAIVQEFRPHGASAHAGKVFRRDYISGAWTSWSPTLPVPTLGGSANADDQTTVGTYHRTGSGSGTNWPTVQTGYLTVTGADDGSNLTQEYRTYGAAVHIGKIFRRDKLGGIWWPWRTIQDATRALNRSDLADALVIDAHRKTAWPVALTALPVGHDLTAELGAGYTEYGYATAPVYFTGLVESTVTSGPYTYRRNLACGTGGVPTPFGGMVLIDSPAGGTLILRGKGNQPDSTQKPSLDVYLDGGLVPDSARHTTTSTSDLIGFKVANLPKGQHVLTWDMSRFDLYSIVASSGLTITAHPAPTRGIWGVTGDSWPAHSDPWGGRYANGIVSTIGRALGVEMYNFAQGGTGYTTAQPFGSAARLASIEAAYAKGMRTCYWHGTQNDFADPSGVQAAATAAWDSLNTSCPDLKLIIVGPPTFGENSNIYATITAGLKAAAAGAPNVIGGHVISPYDDWLMNYGQRSAFIAADGAHPTPEFARRVTRYIVEETIRLFKAQSLALPAVDGWN